MDERFFFDEIFAPFPWGICPFDTIRTSLLPVRSRARLPENAESVLVILFPYLLENKYYTNSKLSKYAIPEDYHIVCGEILDRFRTKLQNKYPEKHFVPFVDASPLPEVFCASEAGLGVVGKNGLLIHPVFGSWVFIGTIVTDLHLPYNKKQAVSCIGCNRCISSCPTHALTEMGLNTDRCISAVTQKKKDLTGEHIVLLRTGNSVWGCDICQNVCPMNGNASYTFIERFRETAEPSPTREKTDRAYYWRGDAVFRNVMLLQDGKP